jgi:hypothetical protein
MKNFRKKAGYDMENHALRRFGMIFAERERERERERHKSK